jgi:hypothetical protein
MDYATMTAPCGMGCFNCKMLQAKDDLDLRKGAAEKFNLEFDKAYCDGGCRETDERERWHLIFLDGLERYSRLISVIPE